MKKTRLPEDAYTGKLEKLKAAAIQKSKLQKKYAHVLKEEGLAQTEHPKPSVKETSGFGKDDSRSDAPPVIGHDSKTPSYRQRKRSRRDMQRDEQKSADALVERLTHKKDARSIIAKRERSKTERGQPKMRDRMANILQKLQK